MNRELAIGPVSIGFGFALWDWMFGVQMLFSAAGTHHVSVGIGPFHIWAEFYDGL